MTDFRDLERELGGVLPEAEADEQEELEQLREEILSQARAHLGLSVGAPLEEIQAGFRADMWEFWLFFFGHFRIGDDGQETPPASFHEEFCRELQRIHESGRPGEQMARAYPREHAKSVFASLVAPLWSNLNGVRRFGVLLSDTDDQAKEFLDDIRIEVETNELLEAVYPEACAWDSEPRYNRLAFGNGTRIISAGSGKSLRGARKGAQRPDYIHLDDIENDEEVENPKRRKKKMRWHNRVVKKLGRAAVFIIVGTILHAESFLSAQVKNDADIHAAIVQEPIRQDLWEQWETVYHDRSLPDSEASAREFYLAHRAQMDAGARLLWPGHFTLYGLMVEKAEDLASFLSERQNNPFDPSASWFPEDRIIFLGRDELPPQDDIVLSVGFWDPARGTSKGDTSSLVRLDCYADGTRIVSESVTERVPPEEIMQVAIGWQKRRPLQPLGVEKVGLSSYDEQLQDLALGAGVALPVEPVTPVGNKDVRIKSLRPLVVSGVLQFAESLPLEAKRQLKFYPSHPNDDFPDAVHAVNALADDYLREVEPAGKSRDSTPEELALDAEDAFGRDRYFGERPDHQSRLDDRIGILERAWL